MKLQEIPVPRPKSTEILVKNSFIGVNFIDTYFRSGLYPTLVNLLFASLPSDRKSNSP